MINILPISFHIQDEMKHILETLNRNETVYIKKANGKDFIIRPKENIVKEITKEILNGRMSLSRLVYLYGEESN